MLDAVDQKKATAFVLIDACRKYAKRVEGKKTAGASMDRAKVNALRPGIGVMFACSDRREALEHKDAGDGHGLFFCSLLEALRDCPRNKRGQVTWGQPVPRVHERVEELADKLDPTTPQAQRQRAQYVGNFSGDPVFLAAGKGDPKPGGGAGVRHHRRGQDALLLGAGRHRDARLACHRGGRRCRRQGGVQVHDIGILAGQVRGDAGGVRGGDGREP